MGRRGRPSQPGAQSGCAAAGSVPALHTHIWPHPRAAHTGALDQDHVRTHCGHH